jgi:hypothetical protein
MNADDFERYLSRLGFVVERAIDANSCEYTVARNVPITTGGLRGKQCDVAIQRITSIPYTVPPAIHTRPMLVSMNAAEPLHTQASALGEEWQYWSRRFDHAPSPSRIWAHILSVLGDSRWVPA